MKIRSRHFYLSLLAVFTLGPLLAPAQTVTATPASVSFGNQVVGTTSSVHKVTLKNGQTSAITITSIKTGLADYAQTNTCPVSPQTLAAAATCTISVTFTPAALGTRSDTLTIADSGTSSPQKVSLTGTGTAPSLVSIAITPPTASVIAGSTQQFTATGSYNNGTKQNLTNSANWSSSNVGVATVSAGLATSVAQGTATIKAKSGTITGSATLTVTAPVLVSISVTPPLPSVALGKTQQFTATGTYSNGTTHNLSSTATWASSATGIATISNKGLASTVAQGSSAISATSGTISGSTTLTVTPAVLTSISAAPKTPSIALGRTQQFTATGTYSNGATQNLSSSVTWTSLATSVATVGNGGLATSVAQGTATITATAGTISGSATLTVTAPTLTSISVTPQTSSIALGGNQPFAATGTYSDGTKQTLTGTVTWSSSATNIATIGSGGLATSAAQGTATIAATLGPINGSATLTVTAPVLTSISVTPGAPSISLGGTQQFRATGTYSDNSTQDLTSSVTWNSLPSGVATVSAGLAGSVAVGTTSITATSGTISGSATLTVTPAVVTAISVTPSVASIAAGTSQQFAATGTYSDGSTNDLTQTANWSSSASGIASVTAAGLASGLAQGSSIMTCGCWSSFGIGIAHRGPAELGLDLRQPREPVFRGRHDSTAAGDGHLHRRQYTRLDRRGHLEHRQSDRCQSECPGSGNRCSRR